MNGVDDARIDFLVLKELPDAKQLHQGKCKGGK